jgi:hypothetical protein
MTTAYAVVALMSELAMRFLRDRVVGHAIRVAAHPSPHELWVLGSCRQGKGTKKHEHRGSRKGDVGISRGEVNGETEEGIEAAS